MEDNEKRPHEADASLYNGQPADTVLQCPGAGLTSCTSLLLDAKDGVSVENVPTPNLHWYVLRVSYGRVLKAKDIVISHQVECYVPMRYKQIAKQGRKRIIKEPLLPSFLFVRSTADRIDALLHDDRINSHEGRPLLSYYYDHTTYCQDNPDRNPPLIIGDATMDNFIRLTSIESPHIIPVTSPNIQYKLGDHVIVTEGEFKGIHGRVARIAGQQRVVVELFDGCLVATAYVPKDAMIKSDT